MNSLAIRLLENSAVMSGAIIIMYVLSKLTRNKSSSWVRYACWVFVAVGLLLPVRPALFAVPLPDAVSNMITLEHEAHYTTQTGGIILGGNEFVAGEYATYILSTYTAYFRESTVNVPAQGYQLTTLNWTELLTLAWALGVAIFLLMCALRHYQFIKSLNRWAVPCQDANITKILVGVCEQVGLRRVPRLLTCPLTPTPLTTGLFRPLLILPDDAIDPSSLRLMLLHEVLHIKRGDIWVRVLALMASAVHWFNPFVYLMRRGILTEAELSCDTAVLHHAGEDARREYGQAVFQTAKKTHKLHYVLAPALSGEGKNLRRRLADIIEKKRTRRGLAIACAVLMIGGVLLAGMLTYEGSPPDNGFEEQTYWPEEVESDAYSAESDTQDYTEEPDGAQNQLIIYIPGGQWFNMRVQYAIASFRRMYPDIELITETVGDSDDHDSVAYVQRVGTELMAGMGPDIIFTHLLEDIHKTMDAGVFMNLSPFWHRAEGFEHRDQLNQAIMDAGVHRGRRYVIPLSYNFPLLLGEQGILESVGIDPDMEMDLVSFLTALYDAVPVASENEMFQFPINLRWSFAHSPLVFGAEMVDFERGIVLPQREAVRALSEALKPVWNAEGSGDYSLWYTTFPATALQQQKVLYYMRSFDSLGGFFTYGVMLQRGYDPVITGFRNHEGELHATVSQSLAIRAGTPNYENAWKFIQLMLSERIQHAPLGRMEAMAFDGIVVNNAAVSRQVARALNQPERVNTVEGALRYAALTDEHKQPVVDMLNNIASVSLFNCAVRGFYFEAMEPFFQGQISLDDAMDELERRLNIYISE